MSATHAPAEPLSDEKETKIPLTENARAVLCRRYLRKGPDGQPIETVEGMFRRVAHHVAKVEAEWDGDGAEAEESFYELLAQLRFMPNSPTFTGAGTPLRQLAACFVLPVEDDMGRDGAGIFQTLRDAALVQQTGGGNGFSFSRLRPKGALVKSSAGQATGPVGFMRVYDKAFAEIAQGGCLLPDTLVFTEQGLLRLDEIVRHDEPGWRAHELKVATDEGTRVSTQGYNNGVSPVLRVCTQEGLALSGTPNHKVKVLTSDGPAWRCLDELQVGDAILVKLGQHRGRYRALRRPIRQHGNQIMPEFPPVLDEELAFFLGYMMGDGFVAQGERDHRVGVSVAHTSYLIEEMPTLFKRVFGEHLALECTQKENDASVTFVLSNRALKEFLLINGLDKAPSREACVPRLIRQSTPEVVGAFLRGLLEADGSLGHHYPQLFSSSKTLIDQVATLLVGLGCPVQITQQSISQDRYSQAPMWTVRIRSFVGLQQWQKRIGCDRRSRFNACYIFEPDLMRETSYVLPHPEYWLSPVLDKITLPQIDRQARGTGTKFRSTAPILRKKLLRYICRDRQLTRSAIEHLAKQYNEFAEHARPIEDLWFVTVSSVSDAGEALTLDIEVQDNHTYLAGGWVTHNSRRGANMGTLRVDHPDIMDFIRCKTNEDAVTNFNISVGITDEFMRAVEEDGDFDLIAPHTGKVWHTVKAGEIFDEIVKYAFRNGEPGLLFLDTANRDNPVPHLYELEATNPCGEQWLGPYENCCLGSINLARHLSESSGQPAVDWEKLKETVVTATRFLDDVVTANAYVPAVPQLQEAAHRARRIGLGIMGLGDMLYHVGIRYGSLAGQEFVAQVIEFVRYHAMRASVELARERGPFPAIEGSIYDPADLKWSPPQPLLPYCRNFGRPPLDWQIIIDGIKQVGIRNAAQTTVAPTGTVATVSGCEAYGCEPVFALAYIRHVNDDGRDLELTYTSPLFEKALVSAGLDPDARKSIIEKVSLVGSCQGVEQVPEHVRNAFVVAQDISVEEHVRIQAAIQAFVDNSISKTINFPTTATEEGVAEAYFMAWRLGCKGLTVYVTGSRDKVVLETRETKQKKAEPAQPVLFPESKKPRPRVLKGDTYRISTPLGTTFVTINRNGGDEPFEVFLHTSKAGSETAAVSEATGRLISYILRLSSPVPPKDRMKEIVRQLTGIGGGRPLGFGAHRVLSLPDGVAQVLAEHLEQAPSGNNGQFKSQDTETISTTQMAFKVGDLCPECGEAALVREEGCRKCYSCGYSEC